MFGFFNRPAGKGDNAAPEKRNLPEWLGEIHPDKGEWITSQVFIDKKNKNCRIYYCARQLADDEWHVGEYFYNPAKDKYAEVQSCHREYGHAAALIKVKEVEYIYQELGYVPVPSLHGNYREVATLHGAYFDEQGNYIETKENTPLSENVLLERKDLNALYSKSSERAIKTWDDFYCEIVHKYPQEDLVLSDEDKQGSSLQKVMKQVTTTLNIMHSSAVHSRDNNMGDENERQQLQRVIDLYSGDAVYRLCNAEVLSTLYPPEPYAAGKHDEMIVYNYQAALLTALMRMGGNLYQQFTASISMETDILRMMSEISQAIESHAQKHFHLSAAQAKQLANVIALGPDPYADKTLPLKTILTQYQEQTSRTAAKNNNLKPPSAG
jgi:hypothetical protein